MDATPSVDVEGEVTEMAAAPNIGTSKTAGTAVGVTKVDVAYYHQDNLLLKVDWINDLEILQLNLCDA